MALDTTIGGTSANSWATLAEYKAYWGARLYNTVPLAASDPTMETALKWACLLLSSLFTWNGTAASETQALPFPRTGLKTLNGGALAGTVIPSQLKNAQCEWAGQLIRDGDRTTDNAALKVLGTESGLTSVAAGPVKLTFGGTSFQTLEAFDAYVRSLGSDLNYLSKIVPDGVRVLLVSSWYKQASLKKRMVFGAF